MENKNFNWRPMSEYTGGRVLATNGLDVLIGEINSDGDCESEEDSGTILCGITGFIKIEEILPKSDDERIRKELISLVIWSTSYSASGVTKEDADNLIAWLEKQGEQSDANKDYWRGYREGKQEILDKYTELGKQGEQKPYGQRKECVDCQFNYAGECKGFCAMKRGEQKPTENEPCEPWSNEQTRRDLIMYIKDSSKTEHPLPYSWRYIKWLENQKEATNFAELMNKLSAKEQEAMFNAWPKEQKSAWSEEDMAIIDDAIFFIQEFQKSDRCKNESDMQNSVTCERFLIFLKDKVAPQSKQEWSEEDENRINRLIAYFEDKESFTAEDDDVYANWLKSLRPQNRWKPGDEQISVLSRSLKYINTISQNYCHVLGELLAQLKKLREE